ncbi:MAG: TIGR02453 family protein [Pseudomonadota bacterium]
MPDHLVPRARAFFRELKANNSRDWFQANKPRFERDIKNPAQWLADEISQALNRQTSLPMATKIFRQNRDVRFSKDKTPYNTHLHMLWSPQGHDHGSVSGYFLGISPDYVKVGAGRMTFDKSALETYRSTVAGSEGSTLAEILQHVVKKRGQIDEPELKRVPSGFAKDHPNAELLRRKGLVVWFNIAPDVSDEKLVKTTLQSFEIAQPLTKWLDSI